MNFQTYVRKPFHIQAVEITADNIEEIAPLVGRLGEYRGKKYISIDYRIVPNVKRAHIGWFLTKVDENYRVYHPRVFSEQFDFVDDSKGQTDSSWVVVTAGSSNSQE